jgi:hypothetical protein
VGKRIAANPQEIAAWGKHWPDAINTGILCRFTPWLDIDLLDADAARAVEELVRERFEERGWVLVRIGKSPKRAIPFRTDEPFQKICASLIAPNGDAAQKIEFLGDGQQCVAFGTHPDTRKDYAWPRKSLLEVPREELPYIRSEEAQQLVADIVALLTREHGYRSGEQKQKPDDPDTGDRVDWAAGLGNIIAGQSLHDNIVRMAASWIGCGMSGAHTTRFLQSVMLASTAPRDERWQERFRDIPRCVRDAVAKFGAQPTQAGPLIQTSEQFVADFTPPDYLIDGVLQRRFLYSLTGKTGSGKTALALLFAACVALGRSIGNLEVAPGSVLYFCGENPDDCRMRWIALATEMDFDVATVPVSFIPGRFKISALRDRIHKEVEASGEVALVIVDTSAAYFEGQEVNSNTQQGEHARTLRGLVGLPGGPCVLVLCHPVKNAAPDNLLPLGAGAFLNEVDGNLTCAIDNSVIEVGWQGKFRGPDFPPMEFTVRSATHPRLKDSKGCPIPTVIAAHLSEKDKEELNQVARTREDQLLAAIKRNATASLADLAKACRWFQKDGTPYKSLAYRTLEKLKKLRLVTVDERDGIALTEKGQKALEAAKPAAKEAKKPAAKEGTQRGVFKGEQEKEPDLPEITPWPEDSFGPEPRWDDWRNQIACVGAAPKCVCFQCGEESNAEKGEVKKWKLKDDIGGKARPLHNQPSDDNNCARKNFRLE